MIVEWVKKSAARKIKVKKEKNQENHNKMKKKLVDKK